MGTSRASKYLAAGQPIKASASKGYGPRQRSFVETVVGRKPIERKSDVTLKDQARAVGNIMVGNTARLAKEIAKYPSKEYKRQVSKFVKKAVRKLKGN